MAARFPAYIQRVRDKRDILHLRLVTKMRQRRLMHTEGWVERKLIKIPSRDEGRTIKVWVYGHPNLGTVRRRPVLVNWHDSGFVVGGFGLDHAWCTRVARDLGIWVIDADYRKAPEDPFPAAVNDAEDVLRWLTHRPDVFDPTRVAVSGFGSGGTLALVAASEIRMLLSGRLHIHIPVAFYPMTDMVTEAENRSALWTPQDVPQPYAKVSLFRKVYLPDPLDHFDARASPMLASPNIFPDHVVIVIAQHDLFGVEAVMMATGLIDAGRTAVTYHVERDVDHGFDKGFKPGSVESRRTTHAYSIGIANLRDALRLHELPVPPAAPRRDYAKTVDELFTVPR